MLIFNEKLLKTRRINQIIVPVFEDEEKQEGLVGYIYSDLDTYRQAVTLMVRFEGQTEALLGLLNVPAGNMRYIDFFKNKIPQPFKMFAPYLGLVGQNEPLTEDIKDLINHLHIIGRSISFSDFVTVPAAARVNVVFTKTSFLTMLQEIKDYTTGLYETEKDESPDGVYWVSSEEIERVGNIAAAISSAFGGMAVQGATQTAASFSSSASSSGEDDIEAELARENANFEDDFDPSEWEDFVPIDMSAGAPTQAPAPATNFGVSTASMPAAPTTAAVAEEEELDLDDELARLAAGVEATNGLI